jgi:hypothetical protein
MMKIASLFLSTAITHGKQHPLAAKFSGFFATSVTISLQIHSLLMISWYFIMC